MSAPDPSHESWDHRAHAVDGHGRFLRLTAMYHEISKLLHRIEAQLEPRSDAFVLDLRKRRLRLRTEICALLREPG